jgi:electron transfer flavoprotein alpha/beta subunit
MEAVIEKVTFKKKKEHDVIRDRIEAAIEGHDKEAVERALDKLIELYNLN